LTYVCQGGEAIRAAYGGSDTALVTFRGETWNMSRSGEPGRYAAQTREWRVLRRPGGEEATLTALGDRPAIVTRCRREGGMSPVAAGMTTAAAVAPCPASALSIQQGGEDAGAGQRYDTIVVRNRSDAVCTVQGFPRVAFLGPDGLPPPNLKMEPSPTEGPIQGPMRPIALQPNGQAVFFLHWTPNPTEDAPCPHVTRLQVTLAGRTVLLPFDAQPCTRVSYSPVRQDPGA
jgi:hypothetical protein